MDGACDRNLQHKEHPLFEVFFREQDHHVTHCRFVRSECRVVGQSRVAEILFYLFENIQKSRLRSEEIPLVRIVCRVVQDAVLFELPFERFGV